METKTAFNTLIKSLNNKLEERNLTAHDLTTFIINCRNNHKRSNSQLHTSKIETEYKLEINIKNIYSILDKSKSFFINDKQTENLINTIIQKITDITTSITQKTKTPNQTPKNNIITPHLPLLPTYEINEHTISSTLININNDILQPDSPIQSTIIIPKEPPSLPTLPQIQTKNLKCQSGVKKLLKTA